MAITFVQQNGVQNSSATTTISASFGSNQTAGHLNILVIGTGVTGSAISTITDSAGNSYTQASTKDNGTGLGIWLYYNANIASFTGSNQVTVTFTASQSSGVSLGICEYSGLATSSPLDGTPTTGDAFASTTVASGSLGTTNATDLVIGAVVGDSNQAFTVGSGYTSRTGSFGSFPISNIEDQITTATGTFTGNFTCGSQNWVAICAAFKTPAGGGNILEITLPTGHINLTHVVVTPRLQSWSVRQSNLNNLAGGGTNVFVNLPQPVLAGSLLVAAALDKAGNQYASASDSVGTSYALATNLSASGYTAVIVYGNAAAAGSNTVGVNFAGATLNPNLWAWEIIGATNSFPLDQVSNASGTGTALNSGGVITNTNNDFLLGYLFASTGMAGGETGWIQTTDATSGTLTEYRAPLASGTYSATGTASSSGTWLALVVSFLPGTGGSGPYRPQPPAGHINLINVVVTPRYPNALRVTLNNPVPTIVFSGAAHPHIPIRPGATGNVILTAKVHGWLHIADQIFVTGTITARSVTRSPIIIPSQQLISAVLNPRYLGASLRPGPITGSIGVPLHGLLVRLNPLRPLPPPGAINVAPVVVTVRYGSLRVTLPPGRVLVTLGTPLNEELLLRPVLFFPPPPALIRTFLGSAPRLMANLGSLLTPGTILTSGTVPIRPLGLFPGAHGTISVPMHILNPEFSGSLRQTASGRINTSSPVFNVRFAGPQEITLPPGQILVHGVIIPRYIGVPPVPPEPATGLCVIGPVATWYDNETEVSQIFFESAHDPSFLKVTSSTSVPWMPAPVLRVLMVPFTDRFYRVRTVNSFGTSYSNISEQTPIPPGPVTVNASGYYVILDVVGADLIMELHPGKDYSYVVQRVIAGPFPDYVSALNEQALINI